MLMGLYMISVGCFGTKMILTCGQKKNSFWDTDEFTGSLLSLPVTTLKPIWSAADPKGSHLESMVWRGLWLICWGIDSVPSTDPA